MAVKGGERAHFEAIGRTMAAEKAADCMEAISSTAEERIRIGFLLGDVPRTAAIEAALEASALGQIGLAQRRPSRPR